MEIVLNEQIVIKNICEFEEIVDIGIEPLLLVFEQALCSNFIFLFLQGRESYFGT